MSMLYSVDELVAQAHKRGASDIHLVCGIPVKFRIDGKLVSMDENVLTAEDCEAYAQELNPQYDEMKKIGELDLAIGTACGIRCRVNLFRQQGYVSAAIRLLNDHIPGFEELGLPSEFKKFTQYKQGIVLVTGETGSGKSTTLACMLDQINHTQSKHIVTLEDPIEYVYRPDQCVINQREIGQDTRSLRDGLKAILREDPDVIMIGELRSLETVETALVAAETGHLVFATLHTNSAADTIDRMVSVFPAIQHEQVRMQLSMCLQGVICQQLLPHASGKGRVLATELMIVTPAIRNLIREGDTPQISNAIVTSAKEGNHLMDGSLEELYRQRKITSDVALNSAHDKEGMRKTVFF